MATTTEKIGIKKPHTVYKLADGTRVPGATTVLGVLSKPQLVKWANNLGLQGIDSSTYVDSLAQVGTLAHYLIQCDLTGESPQVSSYSQDMQDAAAQSIASWLAWRRVHTIDPILNEAPFVSEAYRYGGTIDLYAMIDGVPTLADIKTAKAIYSEHKTQVTAYGTLLAEHGMPVAALRIIRVGREAGEGFDDTTVDLLAERWKFFLACLAVYNLQKGL